MMLAKSSYVLLLVSFWIGSSATFVHSAELIDRIVAIVNGEIVTQRQLKQGKGIIKERFAVQDMIDICILTQEARKEGIPINSQLIEERLSELEERYPQTELETILRESNLTAAEYREWMERMSLQEGMIYQKRIQINEDIRVQEAEVDDFYSKLKGYLDGFSDSEKEVKEFYQIYQEELEEIGKAKIAYFIVKDETIADKIQKRLEEGEDSALLVEEISLGSESFREGEINLRDIKPYLREAIVSLEIGQASKLEVKENGSFWVIQLKERREFLYSEHKDQMESYLRNTKREERLQKWIKELREKADIRIV
ncbi:Chaperone SurA [subsurface metagenome]